MDPFENNELIPQEEQFPSEAYNELPEEVPAQSPVVPEEPVQPPVARKASPYADSPYVMHHTPAAEPVTEKPKKAPRPKKESKPVWKPLVAAVLILALVVSSCWVTATLVNMRWDEALYETEKDFNRQIEALQQQLDSAANKNSAFSGNSAFAANAMTPAQVYANSVDSVVAISTTVQSSYFGQVTEGSSAGSGFILTADGYVVTNYHVVEGATAVQVITHDGKEHAASVVGFDSTNDVALLKVENAQFSPVTLGSSEDLIIGDMVVAIGNPLGELASTQTVGYVSGIGREVSTDSLTTIRMIQTDAAINPGNSGGPLFNMNGEVIGITTAKYSGTTTSGASIEGIGFAIPIDDVLGMISDLMDYGYVTGAYLGVSVRNTDPSVTSMYGLPDGAQVVEVVEGVSAHRAGVQINDIIVAIGEYKVTNVTTLTRALRNFKAGDETTITVFRAGTERILSITLDEKPRDLTSATVPESTDPMPSEGDYEEWFKFFFGE